MHNTVKTLYDVVRQCTCVLFGYIMATGLDISIRENLLDFELNEPIVNC